jgi:erythromycin esterase
VLPLRTLDPGGPADDLAWLDELVGDARVVAIGESAHYGAESHRLRHRLLRRLVERHGFGAYAMETGFVEGRLVDAWVRGGGAPLGRVLAEGTTSLMGLWREMGAHLEWMRAHNATAARPVAFHGIDMPGSMVSLLPGLDAVAAHLGRADPGLAPDPALRETATAFARPSAFTAPESLAAYAGLAPERRDALTAGLADLAARLAPRQRELRARSGAAAHDRALHDLRVTAVLDAMLRATARGDFAGMAGLRDAAMADTVGWILEREERVVLAAHNGHVQRHPVAMPGVPAMTPLGLHLADRLGGEYVVIGTTTGAGRTLNTGPDFTEGRLFAEQGAPDSGSLDALLAASHDGPFAVDLRRAAPDDAAALRATTRHRHGAYYSEVAPLDAFDALVHLPRTTAATPDPDALTHAPAEVREAFARYAAEFRDGVTAG